MSKLTRKTVKLFGSTAGANGIAKFGSFAAGSPVRYTGAAADPTTIQSLSNWLTGWYGAVVGANSPAIEDMNAAMFVLCYFLGYLHQTGVAEWDAGTTYYIGSLVNDGTGILYTSLTDGNLNHALTDGTNWAQPQQTSLITENTAPFSMTVSTGDTMTYPNLTIPDATTITVQTGANLVGVNSILTSGTGTLILQGTATARIL